MSTVSLTGQDTIILDNDIISDLADGNCATLTFDAESASVKTGKNGNAIYALNESGNAASLVLRVILGSADDRKLNARFIQQQSNFSGFILLNGRFVKKVGDGQGLARTLEYIMSGGIFTKQIESTSNVEGDTEQSVAVYNFKFANAPRVIK